jgi:hypothetical protein
MKKQYVVAMALALLSLQLAPLAFSQRAIVITKDNLAELQAKYGPQIGPKSLEAADVTVSTAANVLIGTFSDIMFPSGDSIYQFVWAVPQPGCVAPYTVPPCQFYTQPNVQFQNITVYVGGTSTSFGSINESDALGIAFTTNPSLGTTLDSCQPLTEVSQKKISGGIRTTYSTACLDVALQIQFPTDPYTIDLVDGTDFIAYGTGNTFITPLADHSALYTQCDQDGFCKGQTVNVYAHKAQ